MPFRRLIALLTSNPHFIESLSETKLMRRAAQITVGMYHRFKAGYTQKSLESQKQGGFLNAFKQELSKEHDQMKKDGKL